MPLAALRAVELAARTPVATERLQRSTARGQHCVLIAQILHPGVAAAFPPLLRAISPMQPLEIFLEAATCVWFLTIEVK